jgi:dihydrofolate reductase
LKISLIVAKASNNVIGKDNQLPWRLYTDQQLFKSKTTGHPIIMGRKTFESLGRTLPNRISIVITRNPDYVVPEGHYVVNSLIEAIQLCISKKFDQVFIIGGAEIYQQSIPYCDELLITEVHAVPEGDAFFPDIDYSQWQKTSEIHFQRNEKNDHSFDFITYKKASG